MKYGYPPQQVGSKILDVTREKEYQEVYDFHKLVRIKEARQRSQNTLKM